MLFGSDIKLLKQASRKSAHAQWVSIFSLFPPNAVPAADQKKTAYHNVIYSGEMGGPFNSFTIAVITSSLGPTQVWLPVSKPMNFAPVIRHAVYSALA